MNVHRRWFSIVAGLALGASLLLQQVGASPISGSSTDDKTVTRMREAAEAGDNEARAWMGLAVEDENERIRWFLLAAKEGHLVAMHNLASIYEAREDLSNAFFWWKKLALSGDPNAVVRVAESYQFGRGVTSDAVSELTWRLVLQQVSVEDQPRLIELQRSLSVSSRTVAQKSASSVMRRIASSKVSKKPGKSLPQPH